MLLLAFSLLHIRGVPHKRDGEDGKVHEPCERLFEDLLPTNLIARLKAIPIIEASIIRVVSYARLYVMT
jgi:hypothetical protein